MKQTKEVVFQDKEIIWVLENAYYESGDYVVTIRPSTEDRWKAVPIGPCMKEDRIGMVLDWLVQGGMKELFQIARNTKNEN